MQTGVETMTPRNYYFGIRSWHPQWLQLLASAKFYTFCLCVASMIEGALVSGMFETEFLDVLL